MKKTTLFVLSILLAFALFACTAPASPKGNQPGTNTPATPQQPIDTPSVNEGLSYGDTFVFDDLEITFFDAIEWDVLDNQFSDLNGAAVAKIPMTIKNISDKTHGLNMFYYKQYGPDGNSLHSVSAYFDGEVGFAGDMRVGATQETFMTVLYQGDGDYFVEFYDWTTTVELKLPLQK